MVTDKGKPKTNPRSSASIRGSSYDISDAEKRDLIALTYARPSRYTVAVKVIDIFGNDTMTLVPVSVS